MRRLLPAVLGLLAATSLAVSGCGSRPLDPSPMEDAGGEHPDGGELDGSRLDGGTACRSERSLRVLFVGNSQIDFWDLPQLVSVLSASGPASCPRIEGERFTLGGANLTDLWTGTRPDGSTLREAIESGRYDVIVLAESIDLAEFVPTPYPAQFERDATEIVAAVRAAGKEPLLYATPYIDRPGDPARTGFHAMAEPQLALGERLGVPVALGGLAWLEVWRNAPEVDLFFEDRAHPGFYGSYVSALVLYGRITGGSPVGLTITPDILCEGAPCPVITPTLGEVFQQAARSVLD